jgi:hypothetical protein
MYKVIKAFVDLQDCNYPYKVGDVFPHEGKTVTDERLAELAGKENKQGMPLIELVKEAPKAATPAKPATKKPTAKKKAEK